MAAKEGIGTMVRDNEEEVAESTENWADQMESENNREEAEDMEVCDGAEGGWQRVTNNNKRTLDNQGKQNQKKKK